jgi:hypothetical protein
VSDPVPLFQISKLVDVEVPWIMSPKLNELGLNERVGVGGAEIP